MNDHDPSGPSEPGSLPDPSPETAGGQAPRPLPRRLLSNPRRRWIAAAVLTCAVVGLSAGCAAASSDTSPSAAVAPPAAAAGPEGGPAAGGGFGSGGGSNARSGPAEGGAVGTVASPSGSGFTLTTVGGQNVTVTTDSSTTYQDATGSTASASAVSAGTPVLVLGSTNGTTITAGQVLVQADDGAATSTAAGVVPFQQGSPSAAKSVGQIPENYTEGDGTIVSGSTADQAAEAALSAYPGGVVDRVVQLSTGEYEVHNIGVNWPHHVFVGQDFTVLGAE